MAALLGIDTAASGPINGEPSVIITLHVLRKQATTQNQILRPNDIPCHEELLHSDKMSALVAEPLSPLVSLQPAKPSLATSAARALTFGSTAVLINTDVSAPFTAIRTLFDYLHSNQEDADALNATYPKRGIFKTAATQNAVSDQKFTIDLSPVRNKLLSPSLHASLSAHGLEDVLSFFSKVQGCYVDEIMSFISTIAGANLSFEHAKCNLNFRLCDYNADTADPSSDNGCGAHTDYGTFSVIFQDGTAGLELENANQPGVWIPVPGNATVVLAGWCAVVLSGGRITATRHRVRRIPGVRRLSAVLFAAPDLDTKLQPVEGIEPVRQFAEPIIRGEIKVGWFKDIMGKKWRHREGNESLSEGEEQTTQDAKIERFIWG